MNLNALMEKWSEREFVPIFNLYIYPTYDCTRNCPNCYSSKQGMTTGVMSDETLTKLCSWSERLFKNIDPKLGFSVMLGGEPLEHPHIFSRYFEHIKSKMKKHRTIVFSNLDPIYGISYKHFMNMDYLFFNISNIDFKECDIRLKVMDAKAPKTTVNLTATMFESNLDRAEDIVKYAIKHKFRMVKLYTDSYSVNNPDYIKRLKNKIHKCLDIIEEQDVKFPLSHFFDNMIPEWDTIEDNPFLCGRYMASVRVDGSIGSCMRDIETAIGHIDTTEPTLKNIHHEDILRRLEEKCSYCEVNKICYGGCQYNNASKNNLCDLYQEILPRIRSLVPKRITKL